MCLLRMLGNKHKTWAYYYLVYIATMGAFYECKSWKTATGGINLLAELAGVANCARALFALC